MIKAGGFLDQNFLCILEEYIRRNVIPDGLRNGVNLEYTVPGGEKFIPGTLEVFLSGLKLTPLLDFVEKVDGTGFTIILEPENPWRLNIPPQQFEPLTMNYLLDVGG
jgi:hypothetical protein